MDQDTVTKQFIVNGSLGAGYHSPVIPCKDFHIGSIQLIWTGSSPTGDLTVEFSNQISHDPLGGDVTQWTTLTGSTHSITTGGNFGYVFDSLGWLWMRVAYAYTSGTGTINGTYFIET